MARSRDAGSRKSPVTYYRDKSAIERLVLDARISTRAPPPRSTNCRASWLPRKPAAPVTSVVMRPSRLPRLRLLPVRCSGPDLRQVRAGARHATPSERVQRIAPTRCCRAGGALLRSSVAALLRLDLP